MDLDNVAYRAEFNAKYDDLGCVEAPCGLKIGRPNQPWDIMGPSLAKGRGNDDKMVGRVEPLSAPLGSEGHVLPHFGHVSVVTFQESILEGFLDHILSETASEWQGKNRVWTAQARADRICAVLG